MDGLGVDLSRFAVEEHTDDEPVQCVATMLGRFDDTGAVDWVLHCFG